MKTLDLETLRKQIGIDRADGLTVGFVPTMGALHEGHLSLMRRARDENDRVTVSIFVNPLQFGPNEDFNRYPRDLKADSKMCESVRVDYLFAPEVDEMYPHGQIDSGIEVGRIGEVLEGHYRTGHFRGVATVCLKLFNIVSADRAYFGEKDAQQLAVIQQVVRDLNLPLEIVPCPTVREPDGVAMSSRNRCLSETEREAAVAIPRSLFAVAEAFVAGEVDSSKLRGIVEEELSKEELLRMQYVGVVDSRTFEEIEEVRDQATIVLAAFAGDTRLIDNLCLGGGLGG